MSNDRLPLDPIAGWLRHAVKVTAAILTGSVWLSSALGAVGRVPGEFAVSPTGDATYTIPINVAAGINGLRPDISLAYSSGKGDGLAGIGWTLSGFSSIDRCNKTIATNGIQRGVRFDGGDQFCLNGQPLVKETGSGNSGTYGADGVVYRTEIDQHARVISHGVTNGGPTYFEVKHPNGLTYFYGNTADARFTIASGGNSYTWQWAINQIQDKFFNSIRFEYYGSSSGYDFEPKEIRWTDHCSALACDESSASGTRYKIVLAYGDRLGPDQRTGYLFGASWTRTKRLTGIQYEYAATSAATYAMVQDYQLGYTTPTSDGTQRSQLQTITLCGASHSDCFTSTSMQWQNGVSGFSNTATQSAATVPVLFPIYQDFDGDGRIDIYAYSYPNWKVVRSTGSGFEVAATVALPPPPNVLGGDFDGDGRGDILYVNAGGTSHWKILRSNGSGFDNADSGGTTTGIPGWGETNGMTVPMVADVNGDGRADLVYIRSGVVYMRLNDGNNFASGEQATVGLLDGQSGWSFPPATIRPADFDGDGRQDIMAKYGDVWFTYRYVGDNAAANNWVQIGQTPGGDTVTQIMTADINGDHLTDLVYYKSNSPAGWYTMISQGNGFGTPYLTNLPSGLRPSTGDYDGDGRDDLLFHVAGDTPVTWRVYLSDGTTYSTSRVEVQTLALNQSPNDDVVLFDMTGDGRPDMTYSISTKWVYDAHNGPASHPQSPSDVVGQITDGLGNTFSSITYEPLSDDSYVTGVVTAPAYPNRLVSGSPQHVVTAYGTNNGIGGTYTVAFGYSDAWQNMTGRGFLGFARVIESDNRANSVVHDTRYLQAFPLVGRMGSKTVCPAPSTACGPTGTMSRLSLSTNTWASTPIHYNSDPYYYFVYPTDQDTTEYDPDNGSSVIRITERDVPSANWNTALGVPTSEKVTVRPSSGNGWETTQTYTYGDASLEGTGVWCLGLPTEVAVYRKRPDGLDETRTEKMTYFSNCKVDTRKAGTDGDPMQLVSAHQYNAYGNEKMLTESSGASGTTDSGSGNPLVTQVTTYEYGADSNGLGAEYQRTTENHETVAGYVDTCNNPVDPVFLTTEFSWDYRLGLIASIKKPTSEMTSWTYDAFGRKTDEDLIAGTLSQTTLMSTGITVVNCTSCFPAHSSYKVRADRNDGFWSESYFDAYGRQVGQAHALIDGRESRQATLFDALGQLDKTDVPYVASAGAGSTTAADYVDYTFDVAGRLTQEDHPVSEATPHGATTGYDYNGLNVTITDAENRKKTLAYNANGNLASVTEDPNGSPAVTSYEYTPFDELTKITDAGDNSGTHHVANFGYNKRGFMISRSDGDRGSWAFDYDPWGQLELDSHPRGSTRYEYDFVGRLKNRIDKLGTATEMTTSWSYRSNGLLDVSGIGGYYEDSYSYNNLAQLVDYHASISLGSTWMFPHISYTYDSHGRLDTMTYPETITGTRFAAKYGYSAYGYPKSVVQDGSGLEIYAVGDLSNATTPPMDALGRATRAYYGSSSTGTGPRESYNYDAANLRLTSLQTTASGASGTLLQNYAYTWDNVGNLKSRQDRQQGNASTYVTETYYYDALNRLDYAQGALGTGAATTTMNLSYYPDGNIATKVYDGSYSVGTYNYGTTGAGPHAVSNIVSNLTNNGRGGIFHYDNTGNLDCKAWNAGTSACAANSGITWWSFNLPQRIYDSSAGGSYADFSYGPDRQRVRQTAVTTSPATNKSIYYVGRFFEIEVEGGTAARYRSNVFFGDRLVYSQLNIPGTTPGLQQFYVHQDYQGSVDRVTYVGGTGNPATDEGPYSFDAYGKRRNTDWTNDNSDAKFAASQWMERGYTEHEHLDNVKMIDMNGRVQEPIWGRMLSPDPIIGRITNPQALNAYSYVSNNPATATDPSGLDEAARFGQAIGEIETIVVTAGPTVRAPLPAVAIIPNLNLGNLVNLSSIPSPVTLSKNTGPVMTPPPESPRNSKRDDDQVIGEILIEVFGGTVATKKGGFQIDLVTDFRNLILQGGLVAGAETDFRGPGVIPSVSYGGPLSSPLATTTEACGFGIACVSITFLDGAPVKLSMPVGLNMGGGASVSISPKFSIQVPISGVISGAIYSNLGVVDQYGNFYP